MEQLPAIVEEEIEKVKLVVDAFGRPIDEDIIFTVAALRCHGFVTRNSSAGHSDRSQPPWVDIESPDAPRLLKIMQDGAHSGPEFDKNRRVLFEANRQEVHRLFLLLMEFYEVQPLSYATFLTISDRGPGYGRLYSHAAYLIDESDRNAYARWYIRARNEMVAFTKFLCIKLG